MSTNKIPSNGVVHVGVIHFNEFVGCIILEFLWCVYFFNNARQMSLEFVLLLIIFKKGIWVIHLINSITLIWLLPFRTKNWYARTDIQYIVKIFVLVWSKFWCCHNMVKSCFSSSKWNNVSQYYGCSYKRIKSWCKILLSIIRINHLINYQLPSIYYQLSYFISSNFLTA